MNIKHSALAAALVATFAVGASGQAAAYEYARSQLFIDNLGVFLSDNGGVSAGGGSVTNFDFNLINTAFLNTLGGSSNNNCSGSLTFNTCNATVPRLDAAVVNGAGSVPAQGENTFLLHTPGVGSYSNGDSVILTAALTGDATTSTRQQAEAQINPGDKSASSSSEVGSVTGFTMNFTVVGANLMVIQMNALLNILAEINDPTAATATAKANTEVEFKLSKDGTNDFFTFRPDGAGTNECFATAGLTCTTLADSFDLNTDVNVTGLPVSSSGRSNTAANSFFQVVFGGLTNGQWTLGLTGKTSVQLSRVPEPGILALVGIGLLGLGLTARRSKKLV